MIKVFVVFLKLFVNFLNSKRKGEMAVVPFLSNTLLDRMRKTQVSYFLCPRGFELMYFIFNRVC